MEELIRNLKILNTSSACYRKAHENRSGLLNCHFCYIFLIMENPGIYQDELAKKISVNKSNVTRNLCFLEENGYIERRRTEDDKRLLRIYPTEKMKEEMPLVKQTAEEWCDIITRDIDEKELEVFLKVLNNLKDKAANIAEKGTKEI